jgi:hypothetical protein
MQQTCCCYQEHSDRLHCCYCTDIIYWKKDSGFNTILQGSYNQYLFLRTTDSEHWLVYLLTYALLLPVSAEKKVIYTAFFIMGIVSHVTYCMLYHATWMNTDLWPTSCLRAINCGRDSQILLTTDCTVSDLLDVSSDLPIWCVEKWRTNVKGYRMALAPLTAAMCQ